MPISIPLPIAKGGTGQAATADGAFAAGSGCVASSIESIAVGVNNTSSGEGCSAIGVGNQAITDVDSAIGFVNIASGNYSSAFGCENKSSSFYSSAFGFQNWAYGTRSNAFGYGCYGGGASSSAFGYFAKTTVANTSEFGYWSGPSTRNGAIRTDSTGMAALTYSASSTQLADGGATAGNEAVGTLPRGMAALRHDGDGQTFLDINDAGAVETKNLTAAFGQATSGAGSVAIAVSGTYYKLTTAATLDSANSSYMELDSSQITLKNTSGYTRRFFVTAYINASSNNQKTMIGLRIGKNGTSYAGSEARGFSDDTAHPVGITSNFIVSLADDDYADIYVTNHTDTDTVTINAARISAHSID
jgi:hypothetical protein